MIRLFRQSTRSAAGNEGPALPLITTGGGRSLGPPLGALAPVTPALALHINSEASFPHFKHSRPRSRRRASLPKATPCCRRRGDSGRLGAPPRSTALSGQHIPEVRNAASLVLGMLVLPWLQVHLLLLCLGHLLCLWLLLNVSHSALLRDISV